MTAPSRVAGAQAQQSPRPLAAGRLLEFGPRIGTSSVHPAMSNPATGWQQQTDPAQAIGRSRSDGEVIRPLALERRLR